MSDYHQEQLETQRELERVFISIENHLSPNDRALVRWAFGLSPESGWGAVEYEEQSQLFV